MLIVCLEGIWGEIARVVRKSSVDVGSIINFVENWQERSSVKDKEKLATVP